MQDVSQRSAAHIPRATTEGRPVKVIGNRRRREERRIAQQAQEIQDQADREQAERFLKSFHATTWVPPEEATE